MELDMGNLTWTQIMYRPMHHIQNNVLILWYVPTHHTFSAWTL
jgi:hypothetical protein